MERNTTLGALRFAILVVALAAGVGCGGVEYDEDGRPVERFEYHSYDEVEPLFARFGYTTEAWQAGVREVPRIYLTNIPPRWRERMAAEVSVHRKKRIFFRTLAPLVLRANELLLARRTRLEQLAADLTAGRALAAADREWIVERAVRYRVAHDPADLETDVELASAIAELLVRVDIVPASLALAQGAEESGWGTSRFASEGNALFGQWTWDGGGIEPDERREELGSYRVASFETPLLAVMAYMRNLNSHPAYAELRARRAELRRAGEKIRGWDLAETLTNYSERGQDYVETLHTIMRVNRLAPADDAYLGDTPTIYLVPVGKGSR